MREFRVKTRYATIRAYLIIIFTVAILFTIGGIFFLNSRLDNYIEKNTDLGQIINVSGRQRMLSQNIAKTAFAIYYDSIHYDHSIRLIQLDSLRKLFRYSHEFLPKNESELAILSKEKIGVDTLFRQILTPYKGLLSLSDKIVKSGEVGVEELEMLLIYEAGFLPLMDRITHLYEQLSTNTLETINKSVSLSNYLIVLLILISIGGVFLITLKEIRRYSTDVDEISLKLQDSLDREKLKAEKLEFLTRSINVGIWEKNLAENTETWSDVFYAILGYDRDEIKDTAESFVSLVHPSDATKLMEASNYSIRTSKPSTVELRVKNKSGEYIWIEATGNSKRDKDGNVRLLIGGIIKIHDRKVLEMQLVSFVERAPASIAMFNKEMEYIAASRMWLQGGNIFEYAIEGKSFSKKWKEIHKKCLSGSVEVCDEERFVKTDGTAQWLKWEVRPWFIDEDTIGGILMFTEDITTIIEKREELSKAKEEAEQASKAKEEFLATMSHEIRTPLNAINGIAHILQLEDPRPDQKEHLDLLKFSGENLLNLINDILDISKIESGKLTLDYAPFDLFYLVRNIQRSLIHRAMENLVTININYDERLPHIFIGDKTRLTQVIYNLVGNAIKFTNDGIVKMQLDFLDQKTDDVTLNVAVIDTGIGISLEQQHKIFDSFKQAEAGTTRKYGGTGLGLYISKKILEMMGSEIKVESEIGKGSTFHFKLTLKKTELIPELTGSAKKSANKLKATGINILIVEDNKANQTIIKKFMKYISVNYEIANNGVEALKKIQCKTYDMVLMDLQMPVMDGFTAAHKIREERDEYFKKIPIVALTADAFSDVKQKAISVGMNDYLSKPFKPSDLFEIIDKYVGKVEKVDLKTSPDHQSNGQSNIECVIDHEADGDNEFKQEFVENCLETYEEFQERFKLSVENKDLDLFKNITHKIKSLNTLFELASIETSITKIKSSDHKFYEQVEIIEDVLTKSNQVIKELTRIKNHE